MSGRLIRSYVRRSLGVSNQFCKKLPTLDDPLYDEILVDFNADRNNTKKYENIIFENPKKEYDCRKIQDEHNERHTDFEGIFYKYYGAQ